ncbi:hypothetical protein PI124_g10769 [Phytophthora idaei]|uniref:Uncharacterized protein n=1 Tax=Phytophthora aleatoria TaxID=2496075 RepID=A0A8J5MIT0_9STRA|nr:hypothetical protein PI125_g18949 [Phytophthora idaei]KAG3163492.1 hypothetical protein PI126_g5517 [Phytophthora idaei]KAG3244465.1 hypothetical protein PI124_g10769 [Phytophthora idaei]KAG6975647.1 hypothetical protein JG688_00002158 [Phytophthora aleatoria]
MSSCFLFIAYVCALAPVAVGYHLTNGILTTINGTVDLYSGVYYNNRFLSINIQYPNRCYNVDCNFLANKVESAKWSGLPTTGIDGKAYIVFYAESGCKGYKATITLPHFGGIRDFDVQKVKGAINSFTVMSVTKLVDNGFSNVCSWTGSNVVGGYVAEDNTINMVNATVS